jgi:hypothetical protein
MTTRDELIQLIDDLPDEEQAELVVRLKTRTQVGSRSEPDLSPVVAEGPAPVARAGWDTMGPAAFGAAVLVGFAAGAVGGQVGPVLAALGGLVGVLIGSVVDRRLAAVWT